MTGQRIDPVLIEKAAIAFDVAALGGADQLRDESWFERSMEAAIRVVFDELGLKEERRAEYVRGGLRLPFRCDPPEAEGWQKVNEQSRLCSDWRLVEQGDTK